MGAAAASLVDSPSRLIARTGGRSRSPPGTVLGGDVDVAAVGADRHRHGHRQAAALRAPEHPAADEASAPAGQRRQPPGGRVAAIPIPLTLAETW